MKWWWIIPIILAVIGFFGMVWSANFANMSVDINTDNNTVEAVQLLGNNIENLSDELTLYQNRQVYRFNFTDCVFYPEVGYFLSEKEIWCKNLITNEDSEGDFK